MSLNKNHLTAVISNMIYPVNLSYKLISISLGKHIGRMTSGTHEISNRKSLCIGVLTQKYQTN